MIATKQREITVEYFLYAIALILGSVLRLANLSSNPISDTEAGVALQAFQIANGKQIVIGPQSGYILLTSFIFSLFGSGSYAMWGNFFARIVPAMIGILIILLPFFLRDHIGKLPSVVLAFLLALEPGLIAISKMASGDILAVTFTVYGLVFLYNGLIEKKVRWGGWGGIFLALALLGGPIVWMGWIGILIALAWLWMNYRKSLDKNNNLLNNNNNDEQLNGYWKKVGLGFVITLILSGTLLLLIPRGIESIVSSIVEFFRGWFPAQVDNISGGEIPLFGLFLSLIFYQPLALLFGLWGTMRVLIDGRKGKANVTLLERFLVRWMLVAAILTAVYPSRKVFDLIWILLPLWILAAIQIIHIIFHVILPILRIREIEQGFIPIFAQSILTSLLIIYSFLNLINLINTNLTSTADQQLRWMGVIGSIAIILLITILVGWGWSIEVSISGFASGTTLVLFLWSLSSGWNAAGLGRNPGEELWRAGSEIKEADLLVKTAGDFSEWNFRGRENIDLSIVNIASPALRWSLKDVNHANYLDFLLPEDQPSMIITMMQDNPEAASFYTGQEFVWEHVVQWKNMRLTDWLKWGVYREAPTEDTSLILWVRSDLFPGNEELVQE